MREFFKDIPKIQYESSNSNNSLAFKYYNKSEIINGKTMAEHLRFSMAYWHTLVAQGSDMFGDDSMSRPWDSLNDKLKVARMRAEAGFELMNKLGLEYFCFHDRDIAPEGNSLKETNDNLDKIIDLLEKLMDEYNINLLWGTANLFAHPRYLHGAATSSDPEIFAYAAAQVKKALDITNHLNGENYVLWGGREGYDTLLNTNMQLEQDNLARFLSLVVDYAEKIGFKGQLLIEPKPKEPTKHQYDFDVASVLAFLYKYNLEDYFKVNIEANHAILAGHTFQHELQYARINGLLGSVDANIGDKLLGWDTDQFPTNIYSSTLAMYEILKNDGLEPGGLNFDAKLRRGSVDSKDLAYGFISGMDTYAYGLKVASKLIEDRVLDEFIEKRYSKYQSSLGKDIITKNIDLKGLYEFALNNETNKTASGRQELLENIINQYIFNGGVV